MIGTNPRGTHEPTEASGQSRADPSGVAPLIATHGLSKSFAGSRDRSTTPYAVRDVNIELRAGASLGIVGESGSGKSTLARLVMTLIPPTEGTVWLFGDDTRVVSQGRLRD